MAVTSSQPQDIKVADNLQLATINQGDGFYAFKGSVTINNVTKSMKDWLAEVIPGTGLQVRVRDYIALIDGIVLTDKNKEQLDFTKTTPVSIPGAGTWHILLRSKRFTGYDGVDRPDNDLGVFEVATLPATPDSGKISVAKVVVPTGTTQITVEMIDNSVKSYLIDIGNLNRQVQTLVGSNVAYLQSEINDLQTRIASLESANFQAPLVAYQVKAADVDLLLSTITVDALGNFSLPGFLPTVYWTDNFDTNGELNPAVYTVSGNPVVENQALKIWDGPNGVSGMIRPIWGSYAYPPSGNYALSFDINWIAPVSGYGGSTIMAAHIYDGYVLYINGLHDVNGWVYGYQLLLANSVTSTYVFYYTMLPVNAVHPELLTTGFKANLKFVFNNPTISVLLDGVMVATATDPNFPTSGSSLFDSIYRLGMFDMPAAPTDTVYIDNLRLTSPLIGSYAASGTLVTKQLPSISGDILEASASWKQILPANTSVTVSVSLNGGTDFVSVNNGVLLDGSGTPWNGTGQDLRLKVELATTDTSVTPVVGPLVASSSKL